MGARPQPSAASLQSRFGKLFLWIAVLLALWADLSFAQAATVYPTFNVTVTTAANLGNVVSAYTGSTIFTVNPVDGTMTRSGSAVRLSTGDARAKITVTCVLGSGVKFQRLRYKPAAGLYFRGHRNKSRGTAQQFYRLADLGLVRP